jgi:hypothetical protein
MATDSNYERTSRLTPAFEASAADYVKDTDEWIARCRARVQALDPMLGDHEADAAVRELAALERWRVLKPEAAADQLYAPVKPTPPGTP